MLFEPTYENNWPSGQAANWPSDFSSRLKKLGSVMLLARRYPVVHMF